MTDRIYRPILGTDLTVHFRRGGDWAIRETQSLFLVAEGAPWSWSAYGRQILRSLVASQRCRKQAPRPLRRRTWGK